MTALLPAGDQELPGQDLWGGSRSVPAAHPAKDQAGPDPMLASSLVAPPSPPTVRVPPVAATSWGAGPPPLPTGVESGWSQAPYFEATPAPAPSGWPAAATSPWYGAVAAPPERRGAVTAGADVLLVRPSFSEAVAFARGQQTFPVSMSVDAEPIEFDYDTSFRAFLGYQFHNSDCGWLFTYTNLSASSAIDGTAAAPGSFIVDPFGNLVGTVRVVDPADARGLGTVLQQGPFVGDRIRTQTSVDVDAYDVDLFLPFRTQHPQYGLTGIAGIRLADVQQGYQSLIESGGATIARGDYEVDFFGVGPHLGLKGHRHLGEQGRVTLFAGVQGALLVGTYDVVFHNSPLPGLNFSQGESALRTIPVVEGELGVRVQVRPAIELSAGWMIQSWWDLGASGGNFGGLFTGADDGNVMSFDGFFLRAALNY